MTGQEVFDARTDLGVAWGLGRPLYASELGRVLQVGGRDPGALVRMWETGRSRVPGPAATAITLMLQGARPPSLLALEEPPDV